MSEREPPVANPAKPSFWSVAMVLFAALLIIPGLCFTVGRLEPIIPMAMLALWVLLFVAWVLVLLVKFGNYLARPRR